ncbi:MaoC/PaaZ C-terminal domain-containing protein [Gordonia sp. CPCC 206044]|uniref:MaoC/PaaZ C-terminal domain-containing protein n=1 Tax=Gordonia sp. CPCC 206044 TaxID=3140793 RepID=UPI003AF3CF10
MTECHDLTATGVVHGDDLVVGLEYHLGSHTISEDELVDFATEWDPQSFHIDADAAAGGAFGGLIASGIHTIAVYQRLSVHAQFDRWAVIAGRRLTDVRFLSPVRPGDTLTGVNVIDGLSSDDRNRTLVTMSSRVTNQNGEAVLSLVVEVLVRSRAL